MRVYGIKYYRRVCAARTSRRQQRTSSIKRIGVKIRNNRGKSAVKRRGRYRRLAPPDLFIARLLFHYIVYCTCLVLYA